jgi:putative endonuclease
MGRAGPESTRVRGQSAEDEAARYLEARGLEICERNVQIGGGELDLIARLCAEDARGVAVETIVFVEVRSRAHLERGSPIETIGPRKRARLRRAATAWLVAQDLWEKIAVRFDVVGIHTSATVDRVVWIANAFDER